VLPEAMILATIRQHEQRGIAFAAYVHPHELDPSPLRAARATERLWVNFGRRTIPRKLETIARTFQFGTYRARLDR